MLISNGDQALAIQTRYDISHDNTLSGTGTESSPLGVTTSAMPGNETVLWEGTPITTTGTAITLSEPYTNFEYLDVYGHWEANLSLGNINYYSHTKVDTENQDNFSLYVLADGGEYPYESNSFWTLSSNSATLKAGYYRQIYASAQRNTSFINIDKVIGINRKEEA